MKPKKGRLTREFWERDAEARRQLAEQIARLDRLKAEREQGDQQKS